SSRRRHTRSDRDWSSDVCSSDLHDHRWSPLRYLALCLPIMLFLLGLPNEGFRSVKAVEIEVTDRSVMDKQGDVIYLDFLELYDRSEERRVGKEGRSGCWRNDDVS